MTTTIDQSRAEAYVFTFKEGLLSPMAHDLRVKVGRWSITWDAAERTIDARFESGTLVVDSVMREGQPAAGVLAERDRQKIAQTIKDDVLAATRHPEIRVRASAVGALPGRVTAELELNGRRRPVVIDVQKVGDTYVAEAVVHQPDWGVKPYSAMLGTLKIKPDVRVQVRVAAALVEEDV